MARSSRAEPGGETREQPDRAACLTGTATDELFYALADDPSSGSALN